MMANGCGDSTDGLKRETTYLHVISKTDVAAQKEWARRRCRAWTVESFAASLGLEPSMDAVLQHLTKGLPPESKRAVEEICREELTRNMRKGKAKGAGQ